MGRIPDSPEGVALALMSLILGHGDPNVLFTPRGESEMLALYRRCLAAVRDEEGVRQISVLQDLMRSH